MPLSGVPLIDRDLVVKSRALRQAEERLDFDMVVALTEDIDRLIDRRLELTRDAATPS